MKGDPKTAIGGMLVLLAGALLVGGLLQQQVASTQLAAQLPIDDLKEGAATAQCILGHAGPLPSEYKLKTIVADDDNVDIATSPEQAIDILCESKPQLSLKVAGELRLHGLVRATESGFWFAAGNIIELPSGEKLSNPVSVPAAYPVAPPGKEEITATFTPQKITNLNQATQASWFSGLSSNTIARITAAASAYNATIDRGINEYVNILEYLVVQTNSPSVQHIPVDPQSPEAVLESYVAELWQEEYSLGNEEIIETTIRKPSFCEFVISFHANVLINGLDFNLVGQQEEAFANLLRGKNLLSVLAGSEDLATRPNAVIYNCTADNCVLGQLRVGDKVTIAANLPRPLPTGFKWEIDWGPNSGCSRTATFCTFTTDPNTPSHVINLNIVGLPPT